MGTNNSIFSMAEFDLTELIAGSVNVLEASLMVFYFKTANLQLFSKCGAFIAWGSGKYYRY